MRHNAQHAVEGIRTWASGAPGLPPKGYGPGLPGEALNTRGSPRRGALGDHCLTATCGVVGPRKAGYSRESRASCPKPLAAGPGTPPPSEPGELQRCTQVVPKLPKNNLETRFGQVSTMPGRYGLCAGLRSRPSLASRAQPGQFGPSVGRVDFSDRHWTKMPRHSTRSPLQRRCSTELLCL